MSIMKIVAGSGGNPTTSSLPLFEAGLNLTGAQKPKILLIPSARNKPSTHDQAVTNMEVFGRRRGLAVRTLHTFGVRPTAACTAADLEWADIIYIAGHNTRYMMEQWAEDVRRAIEQAIRIGQVVATGNSAGMLALCESGHSDWQSYEVEEGEPWEYGKVDCLGIVRAMGCPHLNSAHPQTKQSRRESFTNMLCAQPYTTVGIGFDEGIGMQIVDDQVTVLSTGQPGSLHRFMRTGAGFDHFAFAPSAEAFPLGMFVRF